MATGTVKWFDATKGYGFITPHGGGKDVFVHIRQVEEAGAMTLQKGAEIVYDVGENRGRTHATDLVIGRAPATSGHRREHRDNDRFGDDDGRYSSRRGGRNRY